MPTPARLRSPTTWRILAAAVILVGALAVAALLRRVGSSGGATALGPLDTTAPHVGDPAPRFALRAEDGRVVNLDSFRDKPVIINFWATWCGPCQAEIPDLDQVYREYRSRGLVVLGVDVGETAADTESFRQRIPFGYPVLMDADGRVAKQYRVNGLPGSFFIAPDGTLRHVQVGALTRANFEYRVKQLLGE